jgi:hypothetical protein
MWLWLLASCGATARHYGFGQTWCFRRRAGGLTEVLIDTRMPPATRRRHPEDDTCGLSEPPDGPAALLVASGKAAVFMQGSTRPQAQWRPELAEDGPCDAAAGALGVRAGGAGPHGPDGDDRAA